MAHRQVWKNEKPVIAPPKNLAAAARFGRPLRLAGLAVFVGVAALFPFLPGCATHRAGVDKQLLSGRRSTSAQQVAIIQAYRVGCPDMLEIRVCGRPHQSCQATVGPDGRLPESPWTRLRADGRTISEIAGQIALLEGVSSEEVSVRVIDYRSQIVYLFGQVRGLQRSVPYRGPETVLDLLQRTGGITEGAEPNDVHVIRSHIADAKRPEVFRVDLQAIVLDRDDSTNVILLPYDQVHVGETRQAQVERCIPNWLRQFYRLFCDTSPRKLGAGEE